MLLGSSSFRISVAVGLAALGSCRPSPTPATQSPSAPSTFTVAHRLPGDSRYARALPLSGLIVGERWGCAGGAAEASISWQCWEAAKTGASGSGGPLRAFPVPWLANKRTLVAGPDRVCAFDQAEATLRCWHRPAPGETSGRERPELGAWATAASPPTPDTSHLARPYQALVGGTFACLKNSSSAVWCAGDDRFGQLGVGANATGPANVPVSPAYDVALGTWHGCAIAAPRGLAIEAFASCWGRGDFGQLGVAAPDVCVVGAERVPCAKAPQRGPTLKYKEPGELRAGDLFSCATDLDGIHCWGASRDGFFGKPGSCPAALVRAWPTLGAPVRAPNARCSATPVDVPKAKGFQPNFAAGPRGLCFEDAGKVRCVGGIPTPRLDDVKDADVSPGEDASACTVRKNAVVCWGEGYSRANALHTPVAIELEPLARPNEVAIVGQKDPAAWDEACLIHRGCTVSPIAVPACARDVQARDVSDILATASTLVGRTVDVRGLLGVGSQMYTKADCLPSGAAQRCCNHGNGSVVLGGAAKNLALGGLYCGGDESQSCCNAPAYGQSVVARGQLVRAVNDDSNGSGWTLDHATLCTEADGGAAH